MRHAKAADQVGCACVLPGAARASQEPYIYAFASHVAQCDMGTPRTISPLCVHVHPFYDGCMDDHTHTQPTKEARDHNVIDPKSPLVSEMLPAFPDYLRVEEHRTPSTLIRYEAHIQKFMTLVGDCPIQRISSEHLSLYKRRLMDESLAPATMAAMLSGLRSFLRYLKEIRGFQVYDPEKVRRPKIPSMRWSISPK